MLTFLQCIHALNHKMVEVQVDTLHKVFGDLLYTPKLHPNEIAHHHAVCKTSKMLTEQCRQT